MDTIKRCPFCGWWEIDLLEDFKIGDEKCYMCTHCQAVAKESMWNERYVENGLEKRIFELESRIEEMKRI